MSLKEKPWTGNIKISNFEPYIRKIILGLYPFIKNKRISNMADIQKAPDGIEGPGFFATKLDDVVGLARKNSIWPLPFATSCCGIEFMATMASTYDFGRFGSERPSFSPRQADLLMVMGTIAKKNGSGFTSGL